MNDEQLQKILENQARMEEQIKTLFKQQADIKELTETVQKLAIALEKQGMALQSTEKKVDGVKSDVDEIKARTTNEQQAYIRALVKAGVYAAEQIYQTEGMGRKKMEYVKAFLQQNGYDINITEIEAAVAEYINNPPIVYNMPLPEPKPPENGLATGAE